VDLVLFESTCFHSVNTRHEFLQTVEYTDSEILKVRKILHTTYSVKLTSTLKRDTYSGIWQTD